MMQKAQRRPWQSRPLRNQSVPKVPSPSLQMRLYRSSGERDGVMAPNGRASNPGGRRRLQRARLCRCPVCVTLRPTRRRKINPVFHFHQSNARSTLPRVQIDTLPARHGNKLVLDRAKRRFLRRQAVLDASSSRAEDDDRDHHDHRDGDDGKL